MIDGSILVGGEDRRGSSEFHAYNPATGESFGPAVAEASLQDVADACALAADAAETFALAPATRAAFIEAAAAAILDIGDLLIDTAMAETGLPRPRLEGERMRTVNQLRMFAAEIRDGHWLDATIDPALPDRTPPWRLAPGERRARSGRGVRRFQFPARLLGRGRGHRRRFRRRLPRRCRRPIRGTCRAGSTAYG